jgi:large subunit ribosomal protein L5
MSRLREFYKSEALPALIKHFDYKNVMAVPKLVKINVNMGLGEAIANAKVLDVAADELAAITGQRPVVTKARKSIAAFKLRQGMPIGVTVTLRGDRMYEFFDRLVNVALPRVRDFRGVSTRSFDGRGNYTVGLRDQLIFPEIDYGKADKARGMNITFVTTARSDDEAFELLRLMGMPFAKKGQQ